MTTARIYVGTYAKYNNGSIQGAWIDLTDYSDSEGFYQACAELHKDEDDPEFMFQDFEGFHKSLYDESGNIDAIYDYIDACDEGRNQDVIDAGLDCGIPLDKIEDAFYGQFNSDQELAHDWIDGTGMLADVPDSIARYFDYESFTRDLMYDFSESNGYYFTNNY